MTNLGAWTRVCLLTNKVSVARYVPDDLLTVASTVAV